MGGDAPTKHSIAHNKTHPTAMPIHTNGTKTTVFFEKSKKVCQESRFCGK
jgi:hypothetical protein